MLPNTLDESEMPEGFCPDTINRIKRIENHHGVLGLLHLEHDHLKMYTVQETIANGLASKLPIMNKAAKRAVAELDILNELVAYRIETRSVEIIVAPDEEFTAVVINQVKKSKFKGKQKQNTNKK